MLESWVASWASLRARFGEHGPTGFMPLGWRTWGMGKAMTDYTRGALVAADQGPCMSIAGNKKDT